MAKASKVQAPDLSNWTDGAIIDEMAKLSMIENYAKKMRAFYKEAYYNRKGLSQINEDNLLPEPLLHSGEIFTATTTQSFPRRIDQSTLREKYPDIAEECTKESSQLTTRFSLNEGVINPVVGDLIEQLKKELDLD